MSIFKSVVHCLITGIRILESQQKEDDRKTISSTKEK